MDDCVLIAAHFRNEPIPKVTVVAAVRTALRIKRHPMVSAKRWRNGR